MIKEVILLKLEPGVNVKFEVLSPNMKKGIIINFY